MDGALRSSIENQLLYGTRYSGTVCISIACSFSQANWQSPQPMHRAG